MSGNARTRGWLILLAIAGGVLAIQLVERSKGWTARSRAEQLGKELLAAQTPEQAAAVARELGSLEEAAAGPLADALASDEPLVSAAAAEEISRRIGAWRSLSRKASGIKVAALARELAAVRESIPPEQQLAAKRWAEAILLWPLQGSQVDAEEVLANCQAILELPQPDPEAVEERLALLAEQNTKPAPPEGPVDVELPPESVPAEVPVEMPPDESETPVPIVSAAEARRSRRAPEPAEEESPAEEPPLPRPREPRGIYAPGARPIEDAAQPEEPQTLPETEPEAEPQLVPPMKASAEAEEGSRPPDSEVMRDLHSEDAEIRTAAERELSRRGYKASHLALARKLTSPDAAVRLKLALSLPQATGVDPRPWLLHLAEDSDERVRSAALGILRTSQDPELLQKLR